MILAGCGSLADLLISTRRILLAHSVIIRADGSPTLGFGHIVRSLSLAAHFCKNGLSAALVSAAPDPSVRIAVEGFGKQFGVPVFFTDRDDVALIQNEKPHWLLLDLREHTTSGEFLKKVASLHSTGIKVGCIDPFHVDSVPYDLAIVAYGFPYDPSYARENLFGLRYLILQEILLQTSKGKNMPFGKIERILVTMGGSDPSYLSCLVLAALKELGGDWNTRVIVGPGFSPELREKIHSLKDEKTTLIQSPSSLANELLWADFAITAGGMTKFETALYGIPSVVLAQTEQEDRITKEFAEMGSALYAGQNPTPEVLVRLLRETISDSAKLTAMSSAGRIMLDGLGKDRILKYLVATIS